MARFMHTADLWYFRRWSVYSWRLKETFIYSFFNWKMAEMRRPMDFWKGLVGFFIFVNISNDYLLRFYESRPLRKPWSSLPTSCMEHLSTYGYSVLFLLSLFSPIFYVVLPRSIYFTTRIPRSYQILLAKFRCVSRYRFYWRVKCI